MDVWTVSNTPAPALLSDSRYEALRGVRVLPLADNLGSERRIESHSAARSYAAIARVFQVTSLGEVGRYCFI